MGALEDLKTLIMEGKLETELELKIKDKPFKFKICTMTLLEELKALNDAGLSEFPKNDIENSRYICACIPYIIKEINGESIKSDSLKEFIGLFSWELILQIYDAYAKLNSREVKAGDELKNS